MPDSQEQPSTSAENQSSNPPGSRWGMRIVVFLTSVLCFSMLGWIGVRTFMSAPPSDTNGYSSEWLEPLEHQTLGEFSFIDQHGNTVTQDDLRGNVVLLRFFYSRCKTVCPGVTAELNRLGQDLLNQAGFEHVRLVSITLDPEKDTQEALLAQWQRLAPELQSQMILLTGDSQEDIWRFSAERMYLSVGYVPEENQEALGPISHRPSIVFIDAEGYIRGFYHAVQEPNIPHELDQLRQDLRQYLSDHTLNHHH